MESMFTISRFPHHPENVPEELKANERWVTCDEYKVPLIALTNGACFAASSTDPATWRSYETALEAFTANEHIVGIGRVIEASEVYVGIDLDDSFNTSTGELTPWAATIIERLNSYAERSPSGKGVKLWVKAPTIHRAYKKPGLEVYSKSRYFTVTGVTLSGSTPHVEERNAELESIITEEFPRVDRIRRDYYDGPTKVLDLGQLLDRANIEVFEEAHDNTASRKYAVRCPWAHEHSDGDTSGTRVGQYENGALFFRCEHAHCAHRDWRTFRHYAESLAYLGRPPRSERGRLR
jgi:hypothetical protein